MNLQDPRTQKFILVGVLSAAVLYLFFFSTFVPFGHRAYTAEKAELETRFEALSSDLNKARQTLAHKEEIEETYRVLNSRWEVASKLLPEEREVAALLRQVTLVGRQSGVEFHLFRPGNPIPGEVYAEAPVQVEVAGGYHQVGTFLSEVANLERIVNVSNLKLQANDDEDEPNRTVMASFTATAYMLNPAPPADAENASGGADEKGKS
jgi:type IV pilus assembly protein PilO